jgi:hypothetical protein
MVYGRRPHRFSSPNSSDASAGVCCAGLKASTIALGPSISPSIATAPPLLNISTVGLPAKNGIFAPFIYKNDDFAKTGSGQT